MGCSRLVRSDRAVDFDQGLGDALPTRRSNKKQRARRLRRALAFIGYRARRTLEIDPDDRAAVQGLLHAIAGGDGRSRFALPIQRQRYCGDAGTHQGVSGHLSAFRYA